MQGQDGNTCITALACHMQLLVCLVPCRLRVLGHSLPACLSECPSLLRFIFSLERVDHCLFCLLFLDLV